MLGYLAHPEELLLVDKEGTHSSVVLTWRNGLHGLTSFSMLMTLEFTWGRFPMMILLKTCPQGRFLRRKPHRTHQSPTSAPSARISPRGDQLHTQSEKHVSYVAIQKPSEGMKPQGFLQRITLMLMLILEDPVVLPIALLASCVKPPWLFARNGLPLPRRLKVPPSTR